MFFVIICVNNKTYKLNQPNWRWCWGTLFLLLILFLIFFLLCVHLVHLLRHLCSLIFGLNHFHTLSANDIRVGWRGSAGQLCL